MIKNLKIGLFIATLFVGCAIAQTDCAAGVLSSDLIPESQSAEVPASYKNDNNFIFLLVSTADQKEAPVFTDDEFYKHSESVVFKVNKTSLDDDDAFTKAWYSEVLPYINRRHLQLRKLYVRGSASPEGPYDNNVRLGKGRSQTLLKIIRDGLEYQYKDIDTEVRNITEDYGFLCILMEEANDSDASLVRGIYENANGDERKIKQELMAYDSGRLWARLLKTYFPRLRAAHLIIWCTEPDDGHKPLPCLDTLAIAPLGASMPKEGPVQKNQIDTVLRRKPLLALRTNLVHDFFYMPGFGFAPSPNLQMEFYPKDGHWSYNLGLTWGTSRKWDQRQFWQVRDLQFEARRYFKGNGQYYGPYLAAAIDGAVYGIGLDAKKGWQGEGGAASINAGWVLPLTKNKDFKLEFMVGVGYFFSLLDPYVYGNPVTGQEDGLYYYDYTGSASKFRKRNHTFSWIGPTNVGISLSYNIAHYGKKHKDKKRR